VLTKNGLDETASSAKIACWEQKAIRVNGAAVCPMVELFGENILQSGLITSMLRILVSAERVVVYHLNVKRICPKFKESGLITSMLRALVSTERVVVYHLNVKRICPKFKD
jgi:hypothetical protein